MDTAAGPEPVAVAALDAARAGQPGWAATPIGRRLAIVRRLRDRITRDAAALAAAASRPQASAADILLAEILPLAAACRFLEREAAGLLAERRIPVWRRPAWLLGTQLRIARQPFGLVLVIGPANYPLFLPAVQALQALVAGNAVALKPAIGCAAPLHRFRDMLIESGLPSALLPVLEDSVAAGAAALAAGGIDKVILTGSVETGRSVAATLAPGLVPAIMELSGEDPVLVLPGADLRATIRAIVYGVSLNGGATCIAPRRIIAVGAIAATLSPLLQAALQEAGRAALPVVSVPDTEAAITAANQGDFALGASIFGPVEAARACAAQLRAGCAVINDMIAPTADPAVPFGGAGSSGYGVTRGAEGLLACTRPRAVISRRTPSLRHLRRLEDSHADIAAAAVLALHGKGAARLGGVWRLLRAAPRRP